MRSFFSDKSHCPLDAAAGFQPPQSSVTVEAQRQRPPLLRGQEVLLAEVLTHHIYSIIFSSSFLGVPVLPALRAVPQRAAAGRGQLLGVQEVPTQAERARVRRQDRQPQVSRALRLLFLHRNSFNVTADTTAWVSPAR